MSRNPLAARWQELNARYAALSRRERGLVAAAAVALALYGGYGAWVAPSFARAENLARQAAGQERQLADLQSQMQVLQAQVAADPNAPLHRQLAELRRQIEAADGRLASFEGTLVPPARMAEVLDSLLGRTPGVRLASLKSLPAEPLLGQGEGRPATAGVNMYKHGFELKIEGNYLDLAAYLAQLEKQPQELLWLRATLAVERYPDATLTLTFYSLSLDKDLMAL